MAYLNGTEIREMKRIHITNQKIRHIEKEKTLK
jgi:hypothetical protein